MKQVILSVLALISAAAFAQMPRDEVSALSPPRSVPSREAHRLTAEPNEAELLSHRHYNAKDGHEVHSPAKSTHGQVPAGASAKCRDGTYSFSQHHRGTCSHHGGVDNWL